MTTDFGVQDYYVPALKGAILSAHRAVQIVDITHSIRAHDLVQAAFTLKNCWQNFPDGTIHVVSVHNFGGEKHRFLITEHKKHFFIGADNGLFSLLFGEELPTRIQSLPFSGLSIAPIRDLLTWAVTHIAAQKPLDQLGDSVTDIVQRIMFQPVTTVNQIRGTVIHVDTYQNVVVNITRQLFERVGHGRPFRLFFKRHDPITQLSEHYNEVGVGETLCLFNSDYLEIAVHMGKASELLSLKLDDTVQIDFSDT
jgi:S-adenosyl-L-methionine hydrolase (adenosine-forming)